MNFDKFIEKNPATLIVNDIYNENYKCLMGAMWFFQNFNEFKLKIQKKSSNHND